MALYGGTQFRVDYLGLNRRRGLLVGLRAWSKPAWSKRLVKTFTSITTVRDYESELQAQLIPTDHPKPKPYLINSLFKQCHANYVQSIYY